MGIYEFNILSFKEKGNTVFNQGSFVDVVIEGNLKYALYALDMFWVEVVYNVPENKIADIRSFITGNTLNRYSNLPKEL